MSLVPSFVKLSNLWYQGPAIYDETQRWFICFDDDDPPEIVIKTLKQLSRIDREQLIKDTLSNIGVEAEILSHTQLGERLFPPDWSGFSKAATAYLRITRNIDVAHLKVKHDGISEDLPPMGEYVAYDFERISV